MKRKELKTNRTIHITKPYILRHLSIHVLKAFLWLALIKGSPPNFSWNLSKFPAINQFQLSVAFHIETNHLIWTANQITGFYMKCNIRLKWPNIRKPKIFLFLNKQKGGNWIKSAEIQREIYLFHDRSPIIYIPLQWFVKDRLYLFHDRGSYHI